MEQELLRSKIEKWCADLTEKEKERFDGMGIGYLAPTYGYDWNKKYIRIWYASSNSRSSFAFVDQDGNIYKCAGWKAPAKGVRGFIDNPPMTLRDLYARG